MHKCIECGYTGSRKQVREQIRKTHKIKGHGQKPRYDQRTEKWIKSPITETMELV